jgi:hypothetical protein
VGAPAGGQGHDGTERIPAGGDGGGGGDPEREAAAGVGGDRNLSGEQAGRTRARTQGSVGGRPFISYVAVDCEEERTDPDGLDHQARTDLENRAVELVVGREPVLKRTPEGNKGFDLVEQDSNGKITRWVEVKAMTGDLQTRPVTLSKAQFESAREHGDAYWLYVVEHASSPDVARIVRIQDPAGKARTFTFDRGWLSVADVSETFETRERECMEADTRDGED